MTRLRSGIILIFTAVIIVCLFFIPGYPDFYAGRPAVFLSLTIAGLAAAFLGSDFVRDTVFNGNRKNGFISGLSVFSGEFIVILGVLAGFIALYGALVIGVVSGYWGWNWGRLYYFEYHLSSVTTFHITFLQIAVIALIIGQFLMGFGH